MESFRAIILGSDDNAYGTARSFYEINGVKPLLVCTRNLPVTEGSRILETEPVPGIDTAEVFEREIPRIIAREREKYAKVFLIPCGDYYSALCINAAAKLPGLSDNPFITPELYEKLETKDKFALLCEEFGVPHPKTAVIDLEDAPADAESLALGFPLVLKPENSNGYEYLHCKFEGKKKVYYITDGEEYKRTLNALREAGYKGRLVAQEYIPGGDGALYVMNCFSDSAGKVRLMSLARAVLEECAPGMRGNYAALITRYDRGIYAKIKAFLEAIGYVGFANIDLKYDARKGEYYVFELNPRQGRSSFCTHAGGMNLMSALVDPPEGTVCSEKAGLWSEVPKCVIKKYCEDDSLRAEALRLWKTEGAYRTLFNKRDRALRRYYYSLKRYWYEVRTFKKYYKGKNG